MANETQTAPPNGGSGTSIARTGFGEQSVERRNETASTAVAAQAAAEINARFIMAMQRPRDDDNVRVRLLRECTRPAFAKRAYFSLPRGDKPGRLTGTANRIEGLSVRFAEAAVRHMGNVLQTTRTIYDDADRRIVRVSSIDLETNACYERDLVIQKNVERSFVKDKQVVVSVRTNATGKQVYTVQSTEDELLQKESALVSKTFRTEALRLLPADTIEECEQRIVLTVKDEDAKDPDAARKEIADGFARLNVMPSDIKNYLGHDMAQCSPAELADLRGIYASIRDGETTFAEIVAEKTGAAKTEEQTQTTATTEQPPKARGSRLASRVREQGGTPPAATSSTTSTATPVQAPVAGVQTQQPAQDAPKGGTAQQMPMLGGTATVVDGVVQSIADAPKQEPVIPPATMTRETEEERAKKAAAHAAEQTKLLNGWPNHDDVPVVVTMIGRDPVTSKTTSKARMFGSYAVVNVEGFASPVSIGQLAIVK